mgnify:CR=1 FL=1
MDSLPMGVAYPEHRVFNAQVTKIAKKGRQQLTPTGVKILNPGEIDFVV